MIKKLILPAVLATGLAITGIAAWSQTGAQGQESGQMGQEGGHMGQMGRGPMSPDQRLQMLTKRLNLTADQQTKIKPILENESQQMQTLHQDSTLTAQDRMSKMQQIRQSTNEQIKSNLNSDQQQKFEEMMSHQHHGGMGLGGPPPSGQSAPPPQ